MKSHSQHGEDLRICDLLAGIYARYFVDVGANDGYSWSNSLAFVEMGFGALLVEPMEKYAQFCRQQHHGNPSVFVEQVAITPTLGTTKFYINNDVEHDLLAMASSVRREIIYSNDVSEVVVPTCPLSHLLVKHKVPKDYAVLNVDAEGVDLEVLQTADLDHYRPAVICVEYGTNEVAIDAFLAERRYVKRDQLGPNGLYTKLA